MRPKTLTVSERAILANQFRILAQLDEDEDSDHYLSNVEILESGIESEYDQVFSDIKEDVITEEVSKEVQDILFMFWIIKGAVNHLTDDERDQLDIKKLTFRGFDGNNDKLQRRYIGWWIKNNHRTYEDLGDLNINSHYSQTITEYRGMLKLFNTLNRDKGLSFEQLKQL